MDDPKLIVGLPAGSLADPNRGGSLMNLLRDAGFPAAGYDKGGPSEFRLTPFIIGWDGRPQEFGAQLALGELDLAIGGDDWVRERQLEYHYEYKQDLELQKILSLQRGQVRLVIINNDPIRRSCDEWLTELLTAKPLVSMVAEMPYLALEWFQKQAERLGFSGSHSAWSVQKYGTPARIDKGIVIYEAWGKTEAKVKNGAVDFAMEITQTGSAIRNYGLYIAAEALHSEAGVWAAPKLRETPGKYELAQMFLLNLYGAIHAENKVLVLFNIKREQTPTVIKYLSDNHLFADEPTVNEGEHYVEMSVQLDTTSKTLPLARVRYELARHGATSIETVPIESSIPGLGCIDF